MYRKDIGRSLSTPDHNLIRYNANLMWTTLYQMDNTELELFD